MSEEAVVEEDNSAAIAAAEAVAGPASAEPVADVVETDDTHMYAGKYKTAEDLENGYNELAKKLGAKNPSAPDEYTFDFSEDETLAPALEGFDLFEDPMLQSALPAFKKHNISQEAANDIVKAVLEGDMGETVDPQEEINKLGADANQVLSDVEGFVGKFGESEQEHLKSIATTAEGTRLLHKLMKMSATPDIPTKDAVNAGKKADDLYEEAFKIKRETSNFEMNTDAIRRYEALMQEASKKDLATRR